MRSVAGSLLMIGLRGLFDRKSRHPSSRGAFTGRSEQGIPMSSRHGVVCLLIAGFSLVHGVAHAEIFRCVDQEGKMLFSDSPCPKGMRATAVTRDPPAGASPECARREGPRSEDAERQRESDDRLAALRRIEELEREIEDLRSAQAVPAQPVPTEEVIQQPTPTYIIPLVRGGCNGRDCLKPGHRPTRDHRGDGDHRDHDVDHSDHHSGRGSHGVPDHQMLMAAPPR